MSWVIVKHTHTLSHLLCLKVPRVHAQKTKVQFSGNLETDTVGLESLLQVVYLYKLYNVDLKINAHLHNKENFSPKCSITFTVNMNSNGTINTTALFIS